MAKQITSNCNFIFGASDIKSLPNESAPEIAFAGRSNVGKSSLINLLINSKKAARVSSKPGCTRQINFYSMYDDKFRLVDLPGYGYSHAGKEEIIQYLNLIEYYLIQRENLRRVFVLIDSKGEVSFEQKAEILLEVLSSIPSFVGETFVIKCGSVTISDETLFYTFVHNVVLLKQLGINPVIVHDGEYEINSVLKMLGMDSKFVNGIRLTDKDTMKIIEMALCGSVNKKIVQHINSAGGSAIGLCGKDGNLIKAEKISTTLKEDRSNNIEKILDMGFIGRPTEINPDILFFIEESDFIPVIAPIGHGKNGETYHIDADSTASTIAIAVSASKMITFSDTGEEIDKIGGRKISVKNLNALIDCGKIQGEKFIGRLMAYTKMVEECAGVVHIVDGRIPNIMLDLFTENNSSISIVSDL
ncbi:acetylglutamate kinase [Trichonephila inaurata madagascariensis]|uniref:acetylglutamate kinase n=1 Tax=Trichonephila inaurata madagascariensis TaxID=2747483 RepID=A0A8X6Y680_9ARAC|nr:acetylglutamate kinase [Trichonephila inaurata madagascariensis]